VAARAVSAQHRIGSLTPGFRADLAIINAPSLNQWLYHFVPNACTGVIKNGEWVVNMHDA
jgi:imidazolonepropionase